MTKSVQYVLGVDSGGTKSEAILIQPDGTVLGWGRWDVSETKSLNGGGRNPEAVHAAIRRAIRDIPVAGLQVISAGNGLTRTTIVPSEYGLPVDLRGGSESGTLFPLLTERAGVIVLAGTGSHIAGRNPQGAMVTFDGLGSYLGDWGGAFTIGQEALRAAAMSHWHPRHLTSLAPILCRECAILEGGDLGGGLLGFAERVPERWKMASLAKWVDQEAEAGDAIARTVLHHAAVNVAGIVYDVLERLDMRSADLPMIGIGSVATRSRLFWLWLREEVAEFAPRMRPALLRLPPAACHALSVLSDRPHEEVSIMRENLIQSLRRFTDCEYRDWLEFDAPVKPETWTASVATDPSLMRPEKSDTRKSGV